MMRLQALPSTFVVLLLAIPTAGHAHCDGLDGPVVTAARAALEAGDADPVLIWVEPRDEEEVRAAFQRARAVRSLGGDAAQLADTWFFETVVRLHRAGESAPYTGLKPAGRNLGPAIPAADRALREGTVEPLVRLLTDGVDRGVRRRFADANTKKRFALHDLSAGRAYVAAYVPFLHYVERIYEVSQAEAHGHYPDAQAATGKYAKEGPPR